MGLIGKIIWLGILATLVIGFIYCPEALGKICYWLAMGLWKVISWCLTNGLDALLWLVKKMCEIVPKILERIAEKI